MHAIVVGGGAGAPLEWREVADPEPKPHEVLVRIHATAVNRADLAQRRGGYDPPPGAPPYLGLEMAGEVAAVGAQAQGFAVGDRVYSILGGGGYAEAVAADPSYLMPLPDALSFTEGGGLPEVFLTAYVNMFMEAGLAAGETVLIHGGASGVGTAAIQLARHAGATVCVTARSEAKLAACRDLGAHVAVNHTAGRWEEEIAAAAGGVDVILDCVGANYLARNLGLLRERGRLVFIATLGGNVAEFRIGDLMRKRQRLIGSVLRARSAAEKAAISAGFQRDFGAAVAAREILPVIHAVMPVQQAQQAHDLVERYANIGKVVLAVR
ncbi:MAG: NAD(P)H-quinone oxidoreductase [Spirochaetaceae bacterium]|nr:NAD(P)H-quinone oxidoreductase [Spirochaetaceae bacterium]